MSAARLPCLSRRSPHLGSTLSLGPCFGRMSGLERRTNDRSWRAGDVTYAAREGVAVYRERTATVLDGLPTIRTEDRATQAHLNSQGNFHLIAIEGDNPGPAVTAELSIVPGRTKPAPQFTRNLDGLGFENDERIESGGVSLSARHAVTEPYPQRFRPSSEADRAAGASPREEYRRS